MHTVTPGGKVTNRPSTTDDQTTPRPWDIQDWIPGTISHRGAELERFTPIFHGGDDGEVDAKPEDVELIVTAVNERDGYLALKAAVRQCVLEFPPCADCFHPVCMMATDLEMALSALEGSLGASE